VTRSKRNRCPVFDPTVLVIGRWLVEPGDHVRHRPGEVRQDRGVGLRVERVRALVGVELDQGAGLDELGREAVPLFFRTVRPLDPVRLRQLRDFPDPRDESSVRVLRKRCCA